MVPLQGGEIKGQNRVEALTPNPRSFGESKQECCLTTAEDLELLPAMTAAAAGRNPIAPRVLRPPAAPARLQGLCKPICPLLQMQMLTKGKVLFKWFYSRFME